MNNQYEATVYTRPGCMKCHATIRALQKIGISVTVEQWGCPQIVDT